MKKQIFLMFAFSLLCPLIIAQNITVKGVVKSSIEKDLLIGVSVVEKNTTNGTITDIDGQYSISVNPHSTLVFSYIGFTTQEVEVNGNTNLDVILKDDAMMHNLPRT